LIFLGFRVHINIAWCSGELHDFGLWQLEDEPWICHHEAVPQDFQLYNETNNSLPYRLLCRVNVVKLIRCLEEWLTHGNCYISTRQSERSNIDVALQKWSWASSVMYRNLYNHMHLTQSREFPGCLPAVLVTACSGDIREHEVFLKQCFKNVKFHM
jgi:hypothetical protein